MWLSDLLQGNHRKKQEHKIDEALKASFPASDPPLVVRTIDCSKDAEKNAPHRRVFFLGFFVDQEPLLDNSAAVRYPFPSVSIEEKEGSRVPYSSVESLPSPLVSMVLYSSESEEVLV